MVYIPKILKNGTICGIIQTMREQYLAGHYKVLYMMNFFGGEFMTEITQSTIYIFWAVLIVAFGIFEAATAQLVSIWFVFGAIAALVAALLHAPLYLQIIIFIVVSIVALLVTRPIVKKYINPKKEHTNADRVVGQQGIVVDKIDNLDGVGQVKIDGKIWTARSVDGSEIPAGSTVVIEKIEGVKLIVKING